MGDEPGIDDQYVPPWLVDVALEAAFDLGLHPPESGALLPWLLRVWVRAYDDGYNAGFDEGVCK